MCFFTNQIVQTSHNVWVVHVGDIASPRISLHFSPPLSTHHASKEHHT
jgi:hypothetical protein